MSLDSILDKHAAGLAKYGWIAHLVFNDPLYPKQCNVHTHGLWQNYQHYDLQIVVPMPRDYLGQILHTAADLIKAGKRFEPGDRSPDLITNFDVRFIAAREGDRDVLRLIFPDKHGRYEDGDWAYQYEQTYIDQPH